MNLENNIDTQRVYEPPRNEQVTDRKSRENMFRFKLGYSIKITDKLDELNNFPESENNLGRYIDVRV